MALIRDKVRVLSGHADDLLKVDGRVPGDSQSVIVEI